MQQNIKHNRNLDPINDQAFVLSQRIQLYTVQLPRYYKRHFEWMEMLGIARCLRSTAPCL